LRFIPQSLRRTSSTPHSAGFARLELGLFTKPSIRMTSYEFSMSDGFVESPISALRFIPQSLRRTLSTPHSAGLFAFANVTLQALTCFCLFGRWPKIQAPRAAGGR
jgi:hypothetical protein